MSPCRPIAIFGWGTWATTIAVLLGRKYESDASVEIRWWISPGSIFAEQRLIDLVHKTRENPKRLPGVLIPKNVHAVESAGETQNSSDIMILAVPSCHLSDLSDRLASVGPDSTIVHVTKGLIDSGGELTTVSMFLEEGSSKKSVGRF